MFATSSNQEQQNYNFFNKENGLKWKGIFTGPLEKVLSQVHSSLKAKKDALRYVENLNLRLLELLCAKPQPHTIQDVEERVQRTFPNPIDKWAIGDAQSAIEKGKKKINLVLPVEKIHSLLQKEVLQYKVDYQVSVYIVAVLEYISADILKLAGNYVKNIKHVEISGQDIAVAMCADKVLMDMFHQDHDEEIVIHEDEKSLEKATTYDEVVKEIVNKEKPYLRELHLIIKVFRDQIANYLIQATPKDLDIIFSCIIDIAEFTSTLVSSLEDSLEVKEDNQDLAVGSCFEELSEAAEFDYYDKYAKDVLKPDCRNKILEFVQNPDINLALQSAGHGFRDAVKYVLPKLLLNPVYHAFQYFEYIKALLRLSTSESDRESLEQVEGLLKPLQVELERILLNSGHILRRQPGEVSLYSQSRTGRQAALTALTKLNELQKSIDCWEGKEIGQLCNEFICEGILGKVSQGKRLTERYVFLFDGVMILCKQNSRRTSVTGAAAEFKMKEKFFIRKVEIIDRDDSEELKNAFEIAPRLQPKVILFAKSSEEKNDWMAALIMLNTRSMLERTLDSILLDEEKKHPLTLPPPDMYCYSEEDLSSNIVLEEKFTNLPLIKGATLTKLIERLTYHMYADPMLIRTFLTTYRSMCSPQELLGHLIERFEIPDLQISEDTDPNTAREMVKRFKRDYVQPVQFRVLNVIRHWVHHHFYDFERDGELLLQLQTFLDTVKDKSMKKWLISITKVMQRRRECTDEQREIIFAFDKSPPPIEWHIACSEIDFDLMTLHPIEIARQLTLLEFDLYRAVKPSELVGSVWTKKNKEETSPNLLKMIHHTTNVTRWFQKCIVESKSFEERVAVVSRIVEIMMVLQELNNFNGVLAIVSAMGSAAVHRLTFTLQAISYRYQKALDEALQLNNDHFRKYCEKLRSINPPCVPFFGMYLTNILHIEEGNPDFLPKFGKDIINFGKRRKVAEITAEIQQYQDLPYCLSVEPKMRRFLETLDPFPDKDENEICNYLYSQSLVIEPRGCRQPPKFPRRWPDLSLKSPGIKPRHLPGRSHPNPLPSIGDRLFSSTQRLGGGSEDQEESLSQSTSPQGTTPTTPSTPVTPTHTNNDNCIFATVLIGQSPCPSIAGSTLSLAQSLPSSLPPPLPPRRKREPSEGGTSPRVKQAPDAPTLPPRDSTSPPPLPPRSASLPRAQSTTGLLTRTCEIPPRRSSAVETPFRVPNSTHFNGVSAVLSPHLTKHTSFNGGLSSPKSPDLFGRSGQHFHEGVFIYPGDESGHKFRSVPASPNSNFSSAINHQTRPKEPISPLESNLTGVGSCGSGLGVNSIVFGQEQGCLTTGPELPPKSSRLQTLSSSSVCRADHVHGVKR